MLARLDAWSALSLSSTKLRQSKQKRHYLLKILNKDDHFSDEKNIIKRN
jgi:hypothetical protein